MTLTDARRIAIIDLGSNSARVVVMNYRPGYAFHLEDEVREVVRLRAGMTAQGLSSAAVARGLATLRLFKRFCEAVGVEEIVATATSAVREGANGAAFVRQVADDIGLPLRVLSGEEEAYYGTLGALHALPLTEGVVLDIGGGSAQLSQVVGRRWQHGGALTLGALALTERFVTSDPPGRKELKRLRAEIGQQLDTVGWLPGARGSLVGLGGTIRTLARIEAARTSFPLDSINGFTLGTVGLAETIGLLSSQPLRVRERIPGMKGDRADILLAGALVLQAVLERLGATEIHISENGLREGLFFEQFWRDHPSPVVEDLRAFSVHNMARFYDFHERHAQHVRFLAGRLFNQLAPLHGRGEAERALLDAAALLHDLGTVIRYRDHHKHAETMITGSGLPGFTPREVALIALIARFHRRGTPGPGSYAPLMQPGDAAWLTQGAALLRLAEFLERGRNGLVRDVEVAWDEAGLTLTLIAPEFPAVELWDAERNALGLMEQAFGRPVRLEAHVRG